MASKTIYENVKSDFYSVERAGYTKVNEAMFDVVTDLLNHGFTMANISYTDTGGQVNVGTWPPVERQFVTHTPGVGYKVDDILQMVGGEIKTAPFKMKVTSVNATTTAITGWSKITTGDYSSFPENDVVLGGIPFEYVTDSVATGTTTARVAVTAGGDAAPTTITPLSLILSSAVPNTARGIAGPVFTPPANYYYSGGTGVGSILISPDLTGYVSSIPDSRQYTNIVWTLATLVPAYVKAGMLISGDGIPLGTTIVSLVPFDAVTGVAKTGSVVNSTPPNNNGWQDWYYQYKETTSKAYYLVLSNNVTVTAGQALSTYGHGVSIDASGLVRPKVYTAIVEAGAAVDPLNDSVGVFANVKIGTDTINSNSPWLEVDNMIGNRIYAGQLVNSTIIPGSISGVTTVVSVVNTGSTANVTLSSSQTVPDGEQLHFIFVDTQPWRIAIKVMSEQAVAIYAATPTQLTEDGVIAKITDHNGNIIDVAGAMGAMPTGNLDYIGTPPVATNVTIAASSMVAGKVYSIAQTSEKSSTSPTATLWDQILDPLEDYTVDTAIVDPYARGQYFTRKNAYVGGTPQMSQGKVMKLDGNPDFEIPTQGFVNRARRVGTTPEAYPLNYVLTITNRGVFLGVWEGTWSTMQRPKVGVSSYFNWFLVQRPVNRFTGDILTTGRAPVFCINSVGYKYWKFIVREADVPHPSQGAPMLASSYFDTDTQKQKRQITPYRVPADVHSDDSFAILNTSNQIALTEDSKYLIGFLHNLTTPRFRYAEELDMLGQTSADVCSAGNSVAITAYDESGPRQYRALPSNNVYNTGLRICVLKDTPN